MVTFYVKEFLSVWDLINQFYMVTFDVKKVGISLTSLTWLHFMLESLGSH